MLTKYQIKIIILLFCSFVVLRLISFSMYPVMDKTESRYAEIARETFVNNTWIMPTLEGKPFWAKPPLSTWSIGLSYKTFGINDFAAKFPSMIFCLLSILCLFILAKNLKNKDFALIVSLITLTTGIFYILTGGVMTDPALLFTITLAMTSFLLFMKTKQKKWGYWFFVGLGLSTLSKGPIGLIFILMPIFIWAIIFKKFKDIFKNMPIISGFFVFILISVPWYLAAEMKTPGFLNYFIIGEHFYRYVVRHWTGDLYGNPSACPFGTIWVYAFITLMPWIFVFFKKINKSKIKQIMNDEDLVFFILWAIIPMGFFTLSKNVLATYTLPIVPPFAILTAYLLTENNNFKFKKFIWLSAVMPMVLILVLSVLFFMPSMIASQKQLIQKYGKDRPVYYWRGLPYSASFYSNGQTKKISNNEELKAIENTHYYLIITKSDYEKKTDDFVKQNFEKIDEIGEYGVFIPAPSFRQAPK